MIIVIKFHVAHYYDGLREVSMSYTNFQVGEKFPLPIQAAGDGGLFQIDANGAMFILKLSRTDLIATEAFRTGKMEQRLFEEDGIAFFLYQIDGIFKEGWGDCPFSIHQLPAVLLPEKTQRSNCFIFTLSTAALIYCWPCAALNSVTLSKTHSIKLSIGKRHSR